jgi:hypothetical protein
MTSDVNHDYGVFLPSLGTTLMVDYTIPYNLKNLEASRILAISE